MKKILLAEDEKRMRFLIKDYLLANKYEVIEAENGREALDKFYEDKFDLVITDIMMPEMDGIELCEEIRMLSKIPIIMLTAKTSDEDEITGFNYGADEYIKKPFNPQILMLRVEALLKRVYTEAEILELGDIKVDTNAHEVTISGESQVLSKREYDLLVYFLVNKGITLSRIKLLDNVWGFDFDGDPRVVDAHIKNLRKKVGNVIKTVHGVGYKIEEK